MAAIPETRTEYVWMSSRGAHAWRVVLDERGKGRVVRGNLSIPVKNRGDLEQLGELIEAATASEE